MAIYTRFGSEVKLTAARMIPVWIEKQHGRIKWHYAKKSPTRRTVEIDETPIWHFKAEYADGTGILSDGKWLNFCEFVADGGWAALQEVCEQLNPEDKAAYKKWTTSGPSGPDASAVFKPEPGKNIA